MVGAGHSGAAPEPAPVLKLEEKADLFAAGKWTVNPFVAYSVSEIGAFNGDFAGGLALGYAVTKNLTLEAWALGNEYESAPVVDTVDQAGAYLKFYAPIKESGFAPYALLGYGYGQHTQAHNMEMGPGIEYRFKLTGKLGGTVFADAVWVQNFGLQDPVTYARVKIRGGVGLSF
jgi:outer membrane protein W